MDGRRKLIMKTIHFTVVLSGSGDTVDEAWDDAVEGFNLDSGVTPSESEYEIVEDDESDN